MRFAATALLAGSAFASPLLKRQAPASSVVSAISSAAPAVPSAPALPSASGTAVAPAAPSASATPGQGPNGEFAGWTGPNGQRTFTSFTVVNATSNTIINNNQTAVPGQEGASLTYTLGMNSQANYICYKIVGQLTGNYSSPAVTATHMHQAAVGRAGPPRLAFLNPTNATNSNANPGNGNTTLSAQGTFERRSSYGCLDGPFTTGVIANGTDTGAGFTIAMIEANPSGFFVDIHSGAFPAGAVRGQIDAAAVQVLTPSSSSASVSASAAPSAAPAPAAPSA